MRIFLNNIPVLKDGNTIQLRCSDISLKPQGFNHTVTKFDQLFEYLIGETKYEYNRGSDKDFTLVPLWIKFTRDKLDTDKVEIKMAIDSELLQRGCNYSKDKLGNTKCPRCNIDQKTQIVYAVKVKKKIEIKRIVSDLNHNIVTIEVPKDATVFIVVDGMTEGSNYIKRFFWSRVENNTNILDNLTTVIPLTGVTRKYTDFRKIEDMWRDNLSALKDMSNENLYLTNDSEDTENRKFMGYKKDIKRLE